MKTIVQLVQELHNYFIGKDTTAKQAVEANIAPVETDATSSSRSYAQGKKLILNDVLYTTTAAITAGDALTVGTNISPSIDIEAQIINLDTDMATKENAPTILTQTLLSGATSVTFTGLPTTDDWLIDFYAENGANYSAIDLSTAGTAILTYEAPSTNVTIYCVVREVV